MGFHVKVRLLGVFREFSTRGWFPIELEKPTVVREVVKKLVESFPPEFNRLLIDPELKDPRPNALILVNGKEVGVLEGLETEVKNGDEIVLIPISHGG